MEPTKRKQITMTTQAQEDFLNHWANNGGRLDPDGFAGYQCKDVPDAYCLHLFGDWVNTIRPGNGAQVFDNANPTFFEKVRNDPNNDAQIPPRGAICSWTGTADVPEGHVNLVLDADMNLGSFLEQNGYTQAGLEINSYPWELPGGAQLIGWLIPKLAADKPAQCVVEAGDSLWSIAVQFGVSIQGLVNANPNLADPNVIHAGMVLTLP